MKKLFLCFCVVVMGAFTVSAAPIIKVLESPNHIGEPGKYQGYLAIYLNVASPDASMQFKAAEGLISQQLRRKAKVYEVDLTDKPPGLYLLTLPRGQYQISQMRLPFFDLPSRLGTDEDSIWRFNIVAGKVNFIGELEVKRVRSAKVVNAALRNRFATHLSAIETQLAPLLTHYPLVFGRHYRDDFYAELQGEPQKQSQKSLQKSGAQQ